MDGLNKHILSNAVETSVQISKSWH